MNEYNKDIGNRIRELRELSDITIKEIAEKLMRGRQRVAAQNGDSTSSVFS